MAQDLRVLVVLALTLNPSGLTQAPEGFLVELLNKADGQLLKNSQASCPPPAIWRDMLSAFKWGSRSGPVTLGKSFPSLEPQFSCKMGRKVPLLWACWEE